jgi:ABC-type ATPase with predicted acetyltransferase domain
MSQWIWHYASPKDTTPWPLRVAPKVVRCENCGRQVKTGDWPFCPHGKESHA